ncbi:MAG: hypothetical protein M1285_03020 [Candidatus Thermoplasmatota archaeon]|nr:hypothetical protein [Candidatus Thermoplasmatota archaeon]
MMTQETEPLNKADRIRLFRYLWHPLKMWIEADGWKGYRYTDNADIIPALSKAAGAVFRSEIGEILAWMKKRGYIEVLQLKINYIQAFPKFKDSMDSEFEDSFLQRKIIKEAE